MIDYEQLEKDNERLSIRCETLKGLLESSRFRNSELVTINNNLKNTLNSFERNEKVLKKIIKDNDKELSKLNDIIANLYESLNSKKAKSVS